MGNKKRSRVFTAKDPFKRKATLYKDTLESHIMEKHYSTCNEEDVIKDIKDTVEKPEEIYYDKHIEGREVYAKEQSSVSEETIVVVEYNEDGKTGVIATSYPTTKEKWGRQTRNAKKKYSKNGN
jgi:N-acetylglucosamine-6-phosphate deacetylase